MRFILVDLLQLANCELCCILGPLLDLLFTKVDAHSSLSLVDLLLKRHVPIQVVLLLVQRLEDVRAELPLLFKLSVLDALHLLLRNALPHFRLAVRNSACDRFFDRLVSWPVGPGLRNVLELFYSHLLVVLARH